jgi:purine-binding chemotaxis protein CheW
VSEYITFRVAQRVFALDSTRVRALLPMHDMVSLEAPQGWIVGVAALRGVDFPVIDVRGKLGIPHGSHGRQPCIVAVEVATAQGPQIAGFIADRISGLVTLRRHEIEAGVIRTNHRTLRIFDPDLLAAEIQVCGVALR